VTTVIGRQAELAALHALVSDPDVRLVTVTGPGGVGKTELAMRAALDVADRSERGVIVVELADVSTSEQVIPAIAAALDVLTGPDEALELALSGRPTLLVLDNFEQVAGAVTAVVDLLDRCPETTALITSRVPLRAAAEYLLPLAPLEVPTPEADPDGLREYAAVELFLRSLHATGAAPVTDAELVAIAELCRELGGLPLAINLAAARCIVLTPAELLGELRRNGPVRMFDDLGATITWSLDLLDDFERQLIDCVATFAGWCTWHEIGTVARPTLSVGDSRLLDGLTTLLTHHLVESQHYPEARWFRLHPLVRAVVGAALAAGARPLSAEIAAAHDAEAVSFARSAAAAFDSADEPAWLEALDRRYDDLQATLDRALAGGATTDAAALVLGLAPLWVQRGGIEQHIALADRLLASGEAESIPASERSGLIAWRAGVRAEWRTPDTDAAALADEFAAAVALAESSGDPRAVHRAALLSVRAAAIVGHDVAAEQHARRALAVARSVGDECAEARLQVMLCMLLRRLDRTVEAAQLGAAGLRAAQRLEAHAVIATAIMLLVQLPPGTPGLPPDLPDASAAVRHAALAGDRRTMCIAYTLLARRALVGGDTASAVAACAAGIRLARDTGHHNAARVSMVLLTMTCAAAGRLETAARLHGGLADHVEGLAGTMGRNSSETYGTIVDGVAAGLGPDEFAAATAAGRALQWPDLIGEALAAAEAWSDTEGHETLTEWTAAEHPLTGREVEVLRLVADGLSNKQIAAALEMSAKTAMHHTTSIYRKLGVSGRAAATAWAYRAGLVNAEPVGSRARLTA
jgi:predicted ATPase/DNA-binding CsgD family transcriptional regulator